MRQSKFLSAALLAAAAIVATPAVNAATVVKVLGSGSSAMWQTAGLGAYSLAGAGAAHYTVKGSCPTNGNCAQIHDSRSASILNETGNLWIVWNSAQTEVWVYISVDSVVGNRSYFATPRTTLQLDPETETPGGVPSSQTNLISSNLWGLDATAIPSAVYTALNNASVTTAFTDIRPEDAKFANCRTLNQLNTTNYSGLGYGTGTTCATLIGTQIFSDFSSAVANPVNFNIKGTDPFTHDAIPAYTTIDVGAAPIVFLVNRTNDNGLGYGLPTAPAITDLEVSNAQSVFTGGAACDTNALANGTNVVPPTDAPIHVIQREPMSGTMNTTEFTVFRCGKTTGGCSITGNTENKSQESGVNPPAGGANNPLNLPCGPLAGTRQRAVGTGDLVGTGILNTTDSIGYAFFSYGNVSKIAGTPSYGYLTLAGVDPIQATYTNGELPVCVSGTGQSGVCPATPGASFPNLRSGAYKSWSVLRVVTNASGTNLTNTNALVNAIEANVNNTVPDFVPFKAISGDPGLQLYRSHYLQSGVSPNNGLSGQHEAGGDMGGCIENKGPAPGVLSCHQ